MDKHIPGPWIVGPYGDIWPASDVGLVDGKWTELCVKPRIIGSASGTFVAAGEQIANARLISAAPDMLEALKAAVRVAEEARQEWDAAPGGMRAGKLLIALGGNLPGYRADIDAIHAAIAKAEGAS